MRPMYKMYSSANPTDFSLGSVMPDARKPDQPVVIGARDISVAPESSEDLFGSSDRYSRRMFGLFDYPESVQSALLKERLAALDADNIQCAPDEGTDVDWGWLLTRSL